MQWFIRPLAGSGVAEAQTANATPKYEPPAIEPKDILPGTTKQFTFAQSQIFPGTVREEFFKTMDWAVDHALSNQLMVILDFTMT